MSQPYTRGETLYSAHWIRGGLRVTQGEVELASDARFLVRWDSGSESVSQASPGPWRRTRVEALEHLERGLSTTLYRVETDAQIIKGKIANTKHLRAELAQAEG